MMRDQLIQYVNLLFAGVEDAEDMKQEILQNTLDRYDDLVAQGKAPAAAYSLAIGGIGDISEILNTSSTNAPQPQTYTQQTAPKTTTPKREKPLWKKILTAVAVFLYIISVIPLVILSEMGLDTIGLCAMLSIVAVATVAIIIGSGSSEKKEEDEKEEDKLSMTPQKAFRKSVEKVISTVGLVVYFVISFATGAWHITWLVFPIIAAINGVVNACMDLKEAKNP